MKDRIKVNITGVDKQIYNSFKAEIVKRTGRLHGVLGDELSTAMEMYLSSQGHLSQEAKNKNPEIPENSPENPKMSVVDMKLARMYVAVTNKNIGLWHDLLLFDDETPHVSIDRFWKAVDNIIGISPQTRETYLSVFCERYGMQVVGKRRGSNADRRLIFRVFA